MRLPALVLWALLAALFQLPPIPRHTEAPAGCERATLAHDLRACERGSSQLDVRRAPSGSHGIPPRALTATLRPWCARAPSATDEAPPRVARVGERRDLRDAMRRARPRAHVPRFGDDEPHRA
jgi:hypothetical protein